MFASFQILVMEGVTPLKKIIKNLSSINWSGNVIPIAFLSTGSVNPIHISHIKLFFIAKEAIEASGKYKVICGFVSPSQDRYVNSKLPLEAIDSSHRIAMAKLATADWDWIDVDEWEAKTKEFDGEFIDYWQVSERLQRWLNECEEIEQFKQATGFSKIIEVMYVCGSDHVQKLIGLQSLTGLQTRFFIVGRKNNWKKECEEKLQEIFNDEWKEFIILAEEDIGDEISSTKIRSLMKKGDGGWKDLCHSNVVKYIEQIKYIENNLLQGKKNALNKVSL